MKIFNVENGEEVVYIQIKDVNMLCNIEETTPSSIIEQAPFIQKKNKSLFVRINDPESIAFLKNIDWIIDYKKIRQLSIEEITKKCDSIISKIKKINSSLNNMSNNERKDTSILTKERIKFNYKLNDITEILHFIQGTKKTQLPLMADSNGFIYIGDKVYCVRGSLDPNTVLVFRKDKKPLRWNESIDKKVVEKALTYCGTIDNFSKIKISNLFISNYKYLTATLKRKSPKGKKSTPIKKLVKTVFKNKNHA